MHFETLKVGHLETNCYLLAGESSDAIVIDPGGDADLIIERLETANLIPTLILNTHGHADHIMANAALREHLGEIPIAIGRKDAEMLTSATLNLSIFVGMNVTSPPANRLLDEDDVIEVGGLRLRVIDTPGHTRGSVSLFCEDLGSVPAVFCGDTLFAGSVGRTDIPGGDEHTLMTSIRRQLFALSEHTRVYPGHGPETTAGHEKKTNPFVGEVRGFL